MNLIRTAALGLLMVPAVSQRPIDFAARKWPEFGNIVVPVAQAEAPTRLAAELDPRMLC